MQGREEESRKAHNLEIGDAISPPATIFIIECLLNQATAREINL